MCRYTRLHTGHTRIEASSADHPGGGHRIREPGKPVQVRPDPAQNVPVLPKPRWHSRHTRRVCSSSVSFKSVPLQGTPESTSWKKKRNVAVILGVNSHLVRSLKEWRSRAPCAKTSSHNNVYSIGVCGFFLSFCSSYTNSTNVSVRAPEVLVANWFYFTASNEACTAQVYRVVQKRPSLRTCHSPSSWSPIDLNDPVQWRSRVQAG